MNDYDKIQAEINQLELDINRNNYKERKLRTRRLIQKGALLEKYFDIDHLTPEETEELLQIFSQYINEKKPIKYKKEQSTN